MGSLRRAIGCLAAVAALAACATPAERFERRAADLGFAPMLLHGEGFEHRSYAAQAGEAGNTLHVYIEHDGTPWASLDRAADDPTPRTPVALELMAKDTGPRLLLGRPCYFESHIKPPCGQLLWTHERYSPAVVASMVAALRRYLAAHPFRQLVLVGYSGGGTLAWLIAAQMPETTGLVTIAANLDTEHWTRLHGYSPLAGSLNPAAAHPLPVAISERHYVGGRDVNVPPSVVHSFVQHHPRASVIEIADFDHVCCWVKRWPQLLAGTDGDIFGSEASPTAVLSRR
jgi:pimeloyl-ACP methyl ester carboxylesterase